jgi:hypothetical protein
MANEISSTDTLSASKNGVTATLTTTKTRTLTGLGIHTQEQVIGTSAEAIAWPGDLTGEGITEIQIKNLSTANFVEIGGDSGLTVFKIKVLPEQSIKFSPSSGNPTVYAKADTAACNVVIMAVGT